jgi:hypothetical protein
MFDRHPLHHSTAAYNRTCQRDVLVDVCFLEIIGDDSNHADVSSD